MSEDFLSSAFTVAQVVKVQAFGLAIGDAVVAKHSDGWPLAGIAALAGRPAIVLAFRPLGDVSVDVQLASPEDDILGWCSLEHLKKAEAPLPTPSQRAATTRRIRRRAAAWRDQYGISEAAHAAHVDRIADELRQYAKANPSADLAAKVSEEVLAAKGAFWRTVQAGRREVAILPHMAKYWREQTGHRLRVLRQAKAAYEALAIVQAELAAPKAPKGFPDLTFDFDRPTRRARGHLGFPWSSISDEGRFTINGVDHFFDVCRIFDPREPRGERVSWSIDLRRRWGKTTHAIADEALPEVRKAILAAFKQRIEADNRRISDEQVVSVETITVTPIESQEDLEALFDQAAAQEEPQVDQVAAQRSEAFAKYAESRNAVSKAR